MNPITVQVKVGREVVTRKVEIEEYVSYAVNLDPDEMGGTVFALPGLEKPKFIIVFADGVSVNKEPVEVMLNGIAGERRACTPVAMFTADVNTGMDETTFEDGVPQLRFNNPTEELVAIRVIAGE